MDRAAARRLTGGRAQTGATSTDTAASTASVVGEWGDGLALLAGIGLGSIGWFAVLTAGVALAGRRLGDRAVQAADVVAGAGLVGFGALLGVRTLRDA